MKVRGLVFAVAVATLIVTLGACSGTPKTGNGGDAVVTAGVGSSTAGMTGTAAAASGQPTAGKSDQSATGTAGVRASVGASGSGASGSAAVSTGGQGGAMGPVAGGSAGAGGAAEPAGSACVASLKAGCKMRETSACSSFMTVNVGTLVKAMEIKLGPYGATMEYNVGKGFEVPISSSESGCADVAASFGEPKDVTDDLSDLKDVDLALYTVYRPACMGPEEKFPVITWGNGTCGQTEGYGALLRYVASYGYVIFAANSRYTASNSPMTKALDFAEAANEDSKSVYYHRLDLSKIGAMGHSQGGSATVSAASDSRVKAIIIWNAATSAPKPFLSVSGDTDLFGFTPASMANDINASPQPSAWLYYHKVPKTGSVSGHLTLMTQPERVVEATTAWWDYILKGDAKAKQFFVGTSCGLCAKTDAYEYGSHGLQ